MNGKLSAAELAALPAKTKKNPATVALYLEHPFLEAYARHTDQRVLEDGYKGAVGNHLDWDAHGKLQNDFLVAVGLRRHHRLLEIGCGTGRLARYVVPNLEPGHYVGVDISLEAVRAALLLSGVEGWAKFQPEFAQHDVPEVPFHQFDFVWAYSVYIHLPPDEIIASMRRVARLMHKKSLFFWSFVPEKVNARTGLKQFRATREVYKDCATAAGLTFDCSPGWIELAGYKHERWTGSQQIAISKLRVPVR